MPRRCTVCAHPEREAIDAALVAGSDSLRTIAARFGVSKSSLIRHRDKHLPETLTKAQDAQEVARADDPLAQLGGLRAEAHRIKGKAEKATDYRTALAGIRELVRIVELMAKVRGELAQEGTVSIVLAPEWLVLRGTILRSLAPYPDARLAVARALEDGHAQG